LRIKVVLPCCRVCQPPGTAIENPARRGDDEACTVYQWYPAGSGPLGLIALLAAMRLISWIRAA
jgi:hypothetical protein